MGKNSVGLTKKTTWFTQKSTLLDENLTWEKKFSASTSKVIVLCVET